MISFIQLSCRKSLPIQAKEELKPLVVVLILGLILGLQVGLLLWVYLAPPP